MRIRRNTAVTKKSSAPKIKFRALRKPRLTAIAEQALGTPVDPSAVERPRELSRLLTRDETAAYLNCSRNFVDKLLRKGVLPAYKIGALVRIDRDELQAAIRAGVR
jgi:excisionase family DNA binding protein